MPVKPASCPRFPLFWRLLVTMYGLVYIFVKVLARIWLDVNHLWYAFHLKRILVQRHVECISNISNKEDRVLPHFQTLRRELRIRRVAEFF